jgi:hypothetical protein
VTLQIAKPLGSASGNDCIIETLGKGLAGTGGVETSKPARRHVDRHHSSVRRQITELPHVIAVDPPRDRSATGACRHTPKLAGLNGHMIDRRQHAKDPKCSWDQR